VTEEEIKAFKRRLVEDGAAYVGVVWPHLLEALRAASSPEERMSTMYHELCAAFASGYVACLGKGHPITESFLEEARELSRGGARGVS
jgi:hypothetical protein